MKQKTELTSLFVIGWRIKLEATNSTVNVFTVAIMYILCNNRLKTAWRMLC